MKIISPKFIFELELSEALALKKLLGALSMNNYEELMGEDKEGIESNRGMFKELNSFFDGIT